jgi:hypothetical protein
VAIAKEPRTTSARRVELEECPRCKLTDELSGYTYSYEVMSFKQGRIVKSDRLCQCCIAELRAPGRMGKVPIYTKR